MDWFKSLFGKTDKANAAQAITPLEQKALDLRAEGALALEAGNAAAALTALSKSLSYCGSAETYLLRTKAFMQKEQLQEALGDAELGLARSNSKTPASVIAELKALSASIAQQLQQQPQQPRQDYPSQYQFAQSEEEETAESQQPQRRMQTVQSTKTNSPPGTQQNNRISLEHFFGEAASLESWLKPWIIQQCKSLTSDLDCIQLEDLGELSFNGGFAVWHPLEDLHKAPQIAFDSTPHIHAVWVRLELMGYIFWTNGTIEKWRDIGDASTDTDRFFLVQVRQFEHAIGWLNEDPMAFENLGGNNLIETVEHNNGTKIVVIASYDGNARVGAGYADRGPVVCATIAT